MKERSNEQNPGAIRGNRQSTVVASLSGLKFLSSSSFLRPFILASSPRRELTFFYPSHSLQNAYHTKYEIFSLNPSRAYKKLRILNMSFENANNFLHRRGAAHRMIQVRSASDAAVAPTATATSTPESTDTVTPSATPAGEFMQNHRVILN